MGGSSMNSQPRVSCTKVYILISAFDVLSSSPAYFWPLSLPPLLALE